MNGTAQFHTRKGDGVPLLGLRDPMELAEHLAARCQERLQGDEAAALEAISAEFASALSLDLEYIVLMSPEGRTYVHTNKLREGRVYADAANLEAAAIRQPVVRPYERNTGEVIREAVVPVSRGREHYAVLRVGQIVPRGSLRRRVVGSLVVTGLAPAIATLLLAGPATAVVAAGLGLAAAAILGVWNWQRITSPLRRFQHAARAVMAGDLTATVDGVGRDELAQVGFEFNKVVLGLQKLIDTSQTTARRTAELAERMTAGAGQGVEALAQVAATVEEVASGASEQAAATLRVSETTADMGRGIDEVAEGCRRAAEVAASASEAVRDGHGTSQAAIAAIGRIEQTVGEAAATVEHLGDKSDQIGRIVGTIAEIAQQTNLLALNAAIEAARAGEQGRGFAVVADEVRKLAESAQSQTVSIATLVEEIQAETGRAVTAMSAGESEVAAGSEQVRAAARAFEDIGAAITRLSEQFAQVATVSERLGAGSSGIQADVASVASVGEEHAAAAQQVAVATQLTATSTREVQAFAEELAEAAGQLSELVGRFRVK